MMKISGKVDKPDTYKGFSSNISFFFQEFHHTLPMVRETRVQSQVESYQRLKKWYLMPPCFTLSIIRYGSKIK